jgi:hypothetical protein
MPLFTISNMLTQSAQTIYELVQGRKNAALAFFRVKKLCSAEREIT